MLGIGPLTGDGGNLASVTRTRVTRGGGLTSTARAGFKARSKRTFIMLPRNGKGIRSNLGRKLNVLA